MTNWKYVDVVEQTILYEHNHFNSKGFSIGSCKMLYSFAYHDLKPIDIHRMLELYRDVTGAYGEASGFRDISREEWESSHLLRYRTRLLKLEQFRCHLLYRSQP